MAEENIEEQPQEEIHGEQEVYINPGESLPGFPSGHGPGLYLVDYEARTIRPVPVEQPTEATEAQPVEEQPIETEENQGG